MQLNFNAAAVEPISDFSPLPDGEYPMIFKDAEFRETKAGTGEYLQLTAEVIEGNGKGRLVWERINLKNPNATAVEIGQRTLSSICHAIGVLQLQDTDELLNRPFIAKVKVSPAKDGYEATNEIKSYKKYGMTQTVAQPQAPAANQPAPAGWAK